MSISENLVALVTGGSRGIGLSTASALLGRGAAVTITGTDSRRLDEARAELSAAHGGRVRAVVADVRDRTSVEAALAAAVAEFGGLDLLVNNAGVGGFVPVAEMTAADWHRVLDTYLTVVYYCCHAAIPHLKARGGGWIINVSSLASKNAFVGGAAYCASKAGLNAFSEALMQEVRHDGIRVSCVMPGSVRTGFSSGEGAGTEWKLSPDDVAQVIVDLVGHPPRSLPSRVEIRPSRPPRK